MQIFYIKIWNIQHTCHFRLTTNFFKRSVRNLVPTGREPMLRSQGLFRQSSGLARFSNCLINKEDTKSRASCETLSKAASSKSNSALVTFAKVSASLSPMKGERPDNLNTKLIMNGFCSRVCTLSNERTRRARSKFSPFSQIRPHQGITKRTKMARSH